MSDHKTLKIGHICPAVPVIQGGMGVGVSLSGLAAAVAKNGGIGIISTAQIGFRDPDFAKDPLGCNLKAVAREINRAKELSCGGYIGVNIMAATRYYEEYVRAAVQAGADCIISGAGLPMNLPELTGTSMTKIAPIVSSAKSLSVISKYWKKKYNKQPDFVIIEGPKAGGHLGFSREQLKEYENSSYDREAESILSLAEQIDPNMPVVVAGGVYSREDMEHYLSMGASGVQLGTRFVTTFECDASDAYKQAYIQAKKEDIVIVDSPVGMPGRAIRNAFLEHVKTGERYLSGCRQCIKSCDPARIPYCITQALINAVEGKLEKGLIFCGENAWRAEKIEKVADIMKEFAV